MTVASGTNARRDRYVAAYLVFECYRNAPIPIIQVTVSSRANSPATAQVNIHPNRFAYKITRGLNAYIVCRTMEAGIDSSPKDRVMFIGDVVGVQVMVHGSTRDYVLQLTDNRKYLAELPTYYLKLIRTNMDKANGINYRSPSEEELSMGAATAGYEGSGGVASIYDTWADANFYGIGGEYHLETFFYDITNNKVKMMIDQAMGNNTLAGYLKKMQEPLDAQKGWEPYYINMNKKKRITEHIKTYDEGLYQAAIRAEFAEAAWQSVKDTHVELHTTYEDALIRLKELGYSFNTNVYPSITGGQATGITIGAGDDPEYKIKSTLLPGELINIVTIHKDDTTLAAPDKSMQFAVSKSDAGAYRYAKNPEVYSARSGDNTYYAIIDREKTYRGENVNAAPSLVEYTVVPKMYGVLPPKCNWEIQREGVTFHLMNGEPPITALKYTLKDGFSNVSVYTCAYPGGLEFYSLYDAPMVWATDTGEYQYLGNVVLSEDYEGSPDGGKNYNKATEEAIKKYVPKNFYQLVRAIIWAESRGNPHITSSAGAIGLMQVVPKSHPDQRVQTDGDVMLFIEDYNIWAGYTHLYNDIYKMDGNLKNAIKTYNAGYKWKTSAKANEQAETHYAKVNAQYKILTGQNLPVAANLEPVLASPYPNDGYKPGGTTTYTGTSTPQNQPGGYGGGQPQQPEFDINVGTGTTKINKYMAYQRGTTHFDTENIYGIKRRSTMGSAVYELEKAAQYAETDEEAAENAAVEAALENDESVGKTLPLTTEQQERLNALLEAKMREENKESRTRSAEANKRLKIINLLIEQLQNEVASTATKPETKTASGQRKIPVMSREQKFAMIKQKVKKDFYETTVSQNTGTIIIDGLDEDVLVGFPYILYYPPHDLFYYGFVESITHRVDNSAGSAYTEIGLSSISAVKSINTIMERFAGYTKDVYRPSQVGLNSALKSLNKLYSAVAHTENITADEYNAFDLTKPGNAVKITNILTSRPGRRNICTIERLQNYFYNNDLSVSVLNKPASNISPARQWITPAMRDMVQELIDEYGRRLVTHLRAVRIQVREDPIEDEEYTGEMEYYDNEYAIPEDDELDE